MMTDDLIRRVVQRFSGISMTLFSSAKCQDTASTSSILFACVTKAVEIEPLNV